MSFSMKMGSDRFDRIKILQMEKFRNEKLRKTGVQHNKQPGQSTFTKTKVNATQANAALNYLQCPYCNQQILTNNLQHHISFCRVAFKTNSKGLLDIFFLFLSKIKILGI